MPVARKPSSAIASVGILMLTCLVVGCRGDRQSEKTSQGNSVDSGPTVDIHSLDGDIERGALLTNDRVFVQTTDGLLFVYHRSSGERTRLSVPAGPSGKPPHVVWAQGLPDGFIAAYDFRARQVIVFDTAGAVVRATSLESPTGTPSPVAAFGDGSMIVLRDFMPSPYVQETGEYTDTSSLMPVSSDAQPTGPAISVVMGQRIGALDKQRATDETPPRRRSLDVVGAGVFDGAGRHSITVPLSPKTAIAAAADGFYIGRSDSPEVRFLNRSGRELSRFSIAETTLVADDATAARLRRAPKSDLDISVAELYRRVKIPSRTPRYRQLRGDRAGRLWVETFSLDDAAAANWVVYARDGTPLGGLTLPAGSRLLDASETEVLLARKGLSGAPLLQIVRYQLR